MRNKLLLVCGLSLCATSAFGAAQTSSSATQRFTVLRSGRLIARAVEATNDDTHCAIIGTGGAATMQCQPAQVTVSTSYHYNTALVVSADGTGYVIACRAALVTNLWCKKADTGTTIEGRIEGGAFISNDGQKDRKYQLLTSATVGALPVAQPVAAPPATHPAAPATATAQAPATNTPVMTAPAPAAATGTATAAGAKKKPVEARGKAPAADANGCTSTAGACVSFASEPSGRDIYVDGKFAGNTPSTIVLTPGSHEVRMESGKLAPWSRTLETTAGSKINLRGTLEPSAQK